MTGYTVTDSISEDDYGKIREGLIEYNLARIENKTPADLGVFFRDEAGEIIAGLVGETHGSWLTVEFLFVGEKYRKGGIGSELLTRAEEEAKARGCLYAFLDTFGFQAPGFYKKHGYIPAFTLKNYPVTGERIYYTKEL